MPSTPNTLSQGPLNSNAMLAGARGVRPLMEFKPGTANGYGCGPWARLYPSNAYALRTLSSEPVFTMDAAPPRSQTELEAALRGSGQVASAGRLRVTVTQVSAPAAPVALSITQLQTVPVLTGQNFAVGQLFYILKDRDDHGGPTTGSAMANTAVGMVVGVGKQGEVKAVSLVYRGSGYAVGDHDCWLFAPQGFVRVIHGADELAQDESTGTHRMVVAGFHVTEAPPTSECLFVTSNPDTTVTTACAALSRPYRTTTAPFGCQVGDVVRLAESEVLRTNTLNGAQAGSQSDGQRHRYHSGGERCRAPRRSVGGHGELGGGKLRPGDVRCGCKAGAGGADGGQK